MLLPGLLWLPGVLFFGKRLFPFSAPDNSFRTPAFRRQFVCETLNVPGYPASIV